MLSARRLSRAKANLPKAERFLARDRLARRPTSKSSVHNRRPPFRRPLTAGILSSPSAKLLHLAQLMGGGDKLSGQELLIILVVGLIAGWLAGQIVRGTGFGLLADIAIGIVGALIGAWLLPQLGIHLGSGIVAAIISATIGALLLLLILRLAYRGGRW